MSARTDQEHLMADAIEPRRRNATSPGPGSVPEAPAAASGAEHADSGMRGIHTLSMAKAINAGLREAMRADDKVLLMGEDIGPLGGVFRVTEGLQAEFGDHRVLDTPLAESGIVGTAIGLAMRGYRPVVRDPVRRLHLPRRSTRSPRSSRSQTYATRAPSRCPVVIRVPYGGHIGSIEHHQESPEAYFAHTAGPARGEPVEPARRLLDDPGGDRLERPRAVLRAEEPLLAEGPGRPGPLGHRRCTRAAWSAQGTDVTVVGHGAMVATLLQAADIAAGEGTSLEVVDLRSLSPIDYGPLLASVQKTGRLVVAQEATAS